MTARTTHLICNAHIDPVWLWDWEEGVAAVLSTFRTAADLCEAFDHFIFNHNESLIYEWVEQMEPALFKRIRELVKKGRWHIMGGWYLQPDCNLPSGESLVRQILAGRRYFNSRFGVLPTTAINFDPFGHSRGLVQILAKCGFDSYLFCRPGSGDHYFQLESNDFTWVGFDGSGIAARRGVMHYNSPLGKAREKVEQYLKAYPGEKPGLVLWGVGNHGGGPSRQDIENLNNLIKEAHQSEKIIHSTPERYFEGRDKTEITCPVYTKDLNPWAVGCYTSQIRIKQSHRRLENELFATEKMAATAHLAGLMDYPAKPLEEAERDLLFSQFHDILPGSSIPEVEASSLRRMDHGMELLSRVRTQLFFKLCSGQPPAREGEIPILVWNPHPFPVHGIFECEFQLQDQNRGEDWTVARVFSNGKALPTQTEKESSNINLDWRKKVVFHGVLKPNCVNRFDARLVRVDSKPRARIQPVDRKFTFRNERLFVRINALTGLLDRYEVDGVNFLKSGAGRPVVYNDDENPWAMQTLAFQQRAGRFTVMTHADAAEFTGIRKGGLSPVRVIEDGPVRTVVEALLGYNRSAICLHYHIPKEGTEIEVSIRTYWNEKNAMLKWELPTAFQNPTLYGQVPYGCSELPTNGKEAVAQKWIALVDNEGKHALSVINDGSYGLSGKKGHLALSLLRSPAYAAHPIEDRPLVPQDRFTPRIDQGERFFRFWLNAGKGKSRLQTLDREATRHNEKPFALSFFPPGGGKIPGTALILSDKTIRMSSCRVSQSGNTLTIRLFEPSGRSRRTTLRIPALGISHRTSFSGFEIKTLTVDMDKSHITESPVIQ